MREQNVCNPPCRRVIVLLLSTIPILLTGGVARSQQIDQKCGTFWGQLPTGHSGEVQDSDRKFRRMARPILHTSIVSPMGYVRVHYDTTGSNEPALLDQNFMRISGTAAAYVDSIARAFDSSWTVIASRFGYDPPPPDVSGGDDRYDVYIMELSPDLFGETQFASVPFQSVPNSRYETWILIDNDFSTQRTLGLAGAYITAAHELFHAVQIGSYGYWGVPDAYWYELSATWMEEEVFPGVEDYLFEVARYMSSFRTTSFSEYSSLFPGYERVLFAYFMSERFGSTSIRTTWENMRTERVLPALERTFGDLGTSLQTAYSMFAVGNFFTADRANPLSSFRNGARFPRLEPIVQTDLVGQEASISYGFEPLSHGLFAIRLDADTIFVLLTNTDVEGASGVSSIGPAPAIVLSRGPQDRPSQRLAIGVTGGLETRNPSVWDIEYFSSQTGDVARRARLEPFPNPWALDTPYDLIIPTSEIPGRTVSAFLISADFRSIAVGDFTVSEEKGSPAIRINASRVRQKIGSGTYIVVLRTTQAEELTKVVIIQ